MMVFSGIVSINFKINLFREAQCGVVSFLGSFLAHV